MIKWIFGVLGLIVTAGLLATIYFGIGPKPIPLIKPTSVETIESAGVLVYRRMRQDIRATPAILAGGLPTLKNYQDFWQGFYLGAREDGIQFDRVVTLDQMTLFQEAQTLPVQVVASLEELISAETSKKQLYYLPSTETSHLNEASFSKKMDNERRKKISITLHSFFINKEQVAKANLGCENEASHGFFQKLNCLGVRVSQQVYRKKLDPSKNYVALYRFGQSDYVAFWYEGIPSTATTQSAAQ